ncbi:phenylalanine--tRNA ligase subunit beta [Frankia sp. AgB1.9]|uniref:phenylalanine--tRNA ligase subunit beta n=1 Tax=unclassified Frankia TaxID=2632575 RepID=UPI001933C1ED|nr:MULTISPECIES: phenylalanine--tRNA ligase subunit beta [unclassified Frankia]MBL7491645.1 phenylalanine--tRNA ligase subunit beta [Frankia sp. AgW1.1]MBL7549117.1 phenylalanine--tRNA ligase subunit beta [Frankia sp. AgB1.9]MBL7619756.1 phenylalanine--tRNA ligase subunit beta [Frankia sp. AgB1.8]
MLILMSWLREQVPGLPPAGVVADALIRAGFEVEGLESVGGLGGVVVGEVLAIDEVAAKKKSVRWCRVRVTEAVAGDPESGVRGIICGAVNFEVGDRVAVALPGAMLPGGFEITARKTYGHVSDGMICSERELGISDAHEGILVLPPDTPLGAHVAELLDLADDVLDISVTPDRGYGLSVRGIAREAATAFGLPFDDPGAPTAATAGDGYPVTVEDAAACDRYVARVITGVDPAAVTPLRWARRLTLSGMRPISAAVDVTNVVMLGLGQPLHAFDRARLTGGIVVRRAKAGERLLTLDGVDRALDPEDLVIADDSGPIALAGVMGGASTEISAATTEIVLEAAHFDPLAVARTARRHRLFSEASRRFERGVDPALAPAAAQEAVRLFGELAGGQPAPGTTDVDNRPAPVTIRFPLSEPTRLGGRLYPDEVVRTRLADVGCAVEPAGDAPVDEGVVVVTPPSWRQDLTRPADLVEEVMRLEGFDTIPVTLPRLPAGRGLSESQRLTRAIARSLAYEGLTEVMTLPFVGAGVADALDLPAGDRRRAAVRIANPIAEDAAYLRTSLLPGLFDAAVRNLGRGQADLALFEIGQVFRELPTPAEPVATPSVLDRPTDDQIAALNASLPEQPRRVAGVLTGQREPAGVAGGVLAPGRPADWADAVAAAHAVARAVGVELTVTADEHAPWHPGRCAALHVDGELAGHAGELHPRVIANLDLPARTVAFELSPDVLIAAALRHGAAPAPVVSQYPPADRDVALVVDAATPVADVSTALRDGAGDLLESLTLFDVFEGAQVGAGRRSLAFGLRLRATDRTLTADEANGVRDAAVAEAGRRTGAALRA